MVFSKKHPVLAFVGHEFYPIFVLWAIILVPGMVESQSSSLKTQDDSLDSKIL